jgi:hypothetical protein
MIVNRTVLVNSGMLGDFMQFPVMQRMQYDHAQGRGKRNIERPTEVFVQE